MSTPRQNLENVAESLRNMGFRVFLSKDKNDAFGYYSDERHVAYIQANELRPGFNVAICNVTPGSHGRHLILEPNNQPIPEEALTKDYLLKAFRLYPPYFTQEDKDMMPVRKHADLDEFLSENQEDLVEIW